MNEINENTPLETLISQLYLEDGPVAGVVDELRRRNTQSEVSEAIFRAMECATNEGYLAAEGACIQALQGCPDGAVREMLVARLIELVPSVWEPESNDWVMDWIALDELIQAVRHEYDENLVEPLGRILGFLRESGEGNAKETDSILPTFESAYMALSEWGVLRIDASFRQQ